GLARRQREPAVAQEDGGHAVPAGAAPDRVPRDLRVHVGVAVDESRSHDESLGVDGSLGHRPDAPDLDDPAVAHAHVTPVARRTRAVDDGAVLDQELERHAVFLRCGFSYGTMTCSVVMMNAGSPGARKFGSSARVRPYSGEAADARIAPVSSNQAIATPSYAGVRPRS